MCVWEGGGGGVVWGGTACVCVVRITITYILHLTPNVKGTRLDYSSQSFGCLSTIQIPCHICKFNRQTKWKIKILLFLLLFKMAACKEIQIQDTVKSNCLVLVL